MRGGVLDPTPVAGMPAIRAVVIGGLGDVVLHPSYRRNRLIYFAYSKPDARDPSLSTLAVARARFDGGAALTDLEDVFVAADWYSSAMAGQNNRCCGQGPADASFGARLAFGRFRALHLGDLTVNKEFDLMCPNNPIGTVDLFMVTHHGLPSSNNPVLVRAVDPRPVEALHGAGASRSALVLYALVPEALPQLISYTLYRWECAIRASAILGFVGAGGIGQQIELSMRMFQFDEVFTLLALLLVLVGAVDFVSGRIRAAVVR